MSYQMNRLLGKLTGSGDFIGKYRWRYVRLAVINVLLIAAALRLVEVNIDKVASIRYLLSAIAQALATVFALSVTIPMLFMQHLAQSPGSRRWLRLELRPTQLLFYLSFVITIMWSLILLAMNSYPPIGIKLIIGLTAVCLYSTIESAYGFKQKVGMYRE